MWFCFSNQSNIKQNDFKFKSWKLTFKYVFLVGVDIAFWFDIFFRVVSHSDHDCGNLFVWVSLQSLKMCSQETLATNARRKYEMRARTYTWTMFFTSFLNPSDLHMDHVPHSLFFNPLPWPCAHSCKLSSPTWKARQITQGRQKLALPSVKLLVMG